MTQSSSPPPPLSGAQKGGIAVTIAAILASVYVVEGGFVDHPNDPGGATNFGVTQEVARQAGYTGDMRDFPKHCPGVAPKEVCADNIYVSRYIEAPGFMPLVAIEPAIAEELIDTAVNMGPPRPSRWFQQSINEAGGYRLTVDGKVGKATVGAYVALQGKLGSRSACISILNRLDAKQVAEYQRLVAVNPKLRVFLKGWTRHRIGNVHRARCGTGA